MTTTYPRIWLSRAGAHGEDEDTALVDGLAIVGFREVGDLRVFASPAELALALAATDPDQNVKRAENRARQLWTFRESMALGDTVVLPLKTRHGQIALGQIAGPYVYREVGGELRHTRRVDWLLPDVSRTAFAQDLLYSFGALMTVCRITRNEAEARVAAVLGGMPDPGLSGGQLSTSTVTVADADVAVAFDIAQAAHDEIAAFVRLRFQGHELARLVEAVLQGEDFVTQRSAPGPDGGADILAGRGPLGLDAPTVCVQVKATEAAADVTVFRALQGTMSSFGAAQGLLVCWGGFTQAVRIEARQHSFKVRLWDQSDLVQAIYRIYDRLPEEIQAELPLKPVWVLVREDE